MIIFNIFYKCLKCFYYYDNIKNLVELILLSNKYLNQFHQYNEYFHILQYNKLIEYSNSKITKYVQFPFVLLQQDDIQRISKDLLKFKMI